VAIAPDASVIVVAWKDGSITRIDPANGATLAERELWGGSAFELVISPDARTIAASSWSRTVRLIDMDSLAVRDCFGGTHAHVWGIAFSPDGTRIFGRIVLPELTKPGAPKSNADCAGAWIVAGNKAIRSIDTQHRPVVATYGPVPSMFTSATDDGTIYEFDAAQGTTRALGVVAGLNTSSVIYSIARSERFIAVGLTDGAVVLLEPREQDDGLGNERKGGANATASLVERWRVRPGVNGSVTLAFDPKGAMIACGFSGNSAAMLSVADGGVLWTAELPTGVAVPGRMSVVKPVFEGEQDRVAFATVLSNSPFRLFRAHDGKVLNPNGNSKMAECDVGIWRAEDEHFYFLGITGCIFTDEGHIASTKNIAQDGGVLCTDRAQTRIFTATREAVTRVIAFDPLEEIMRLDSPAGRPVAIGFDDALDQLTVLTSSGVARSWLGRTIAPPTIVARPTLKGSVFDAPPYDEPAPRRDQK
jgi:WD40 repeat protein